MPDFVEISYPATCISANKPLKTSDLKKFFDKLPVDFLLMDMESFGFEFVMQKFNLPRLILKVPVDFTDEQLEKFSFEKALNLLASIEYEKIFTKVSDFLNKLPSNEENFYGLPFTVSEKEIFNFLSKKYKFVYGDFDKFIKEFLVANESLNKKQQAKKHLHRRLSTHRIRTRTQVKRIQRKRNKRRPKTLSKISKPT